jgi:transporter family-2 protein
MEFLYILSGISAGIVVVFARSINANLARKIGLNSSTFFNFIVGLIVSFIVLILLGDGLGSYSKVDIGVIPSWAYIGSVLGVGVVFLSNYTAMRISAFYLTLLIFIGQLFSGVLIDFVILDSLSIGKLLGGLLVLIGLSYNLLLDKRAS